VSPGNRVGSTAVPARESVEGSAARTGRRVRLHGIDAVRALAILGMVYMHVSPTGWLVPLTYSEKPAVLAWLESLLAGRSMSVFVLLAGISVALMTGGTRPVEGEHLTTARKRLAMRGGALFLISLLVDQFSGLNLSILEYYALWMLLLIPVLRLPVKPLLTSAGVAAALLPVFNFVIMNYGRDWTISPFTGGAEPVVGLVVLIQPQDWLPKIKQLFVGGGFQTPYAIPLLLAGLAIGRLDLQDTLVRRKLALIGTVLLGGSWLVSRLALGPFGVQQGLAEMMSGEGPLLQPWGSLFTLPPHQLYAMSIPMAPFMLGVGLLLLYAFLPLLERSFWQRLLLPLTTAGRMALTWYAAHQIYLQRVAADPPYAFALFAGMAIFALIVSPLWFIWRQRGPLEGLLYQVTTVAIPVGEPAPATSSRAGQPEGASRE